MNDWTFDSSPLKDYPATSDTFTDAQGQHWIAGQPVHPAVWERYEEVWGHIEKLSGVKEAGKRLAAVTDSDRETRRRFAKDFRRVLDEEETRRKAL